MSCTQFDRSFSEEISELLRRVEELQIRYIRTRRHEQAFMLHQVADLLMALKGEEIEPDELAVTDGVSRLVQ